MVEPKLRFENRKEPLTSRLIGDIYTERKEPGDESLPILTVSIHSGVSDGALDDDDLGKHVKRSEDKTKYKRAEKDDVVFNMMRAWQGAIGVVRTTGMVNPAYIVAKPDASVFPLFMDYYLKSPKMINVINRLSYGLMDFRKRLYWDSFASINCQLPPIEEQKDICTLLERVDNIISFSEKELLKWKSLKKGMLQKLLPSIKEDMPELRFSMFDGAWEKKKLSDICDYTSSALAIKDAKENGKYDLYDANGIIGKTDNEPIQSDYVSIIKDGAGVGRVRKLPGQSLIIGTMGALIPRDSNIDYLVALLEKSNLGGQASGSTIPHIYFKDYGSILYPVPSIEEQEVIGVYFNKIDELITIQNQELEKWKEIKKGLLQQLFV